MKILVTDDDRVVRAVMTRMLEACGHTVLTAENGERGTAVFRNAQPDLVITDMVMPEQEGIETIRLIRRERPEARIVAMSGDVPDAEFNILAIARQLGADDAIRKPIAAADLRALVERFVGAARSPC